MKHGVRMFLNGCISSGAAIAAYLIATKLFGAGVVASALACLAGGWALYYIDKEDRQRGYE